MDEPSKLLDDPAVSEPVRAALEWYPKVDPPAGAQAAVEAKLIAKLGLGAAAAASKVGIATKLLLLAAATGAVYGGYRLVEHAGRSATVDAPPIAAAVAPKVEASAPMAVPEATVEVEASPALAVATAGVEASHPHPLLRARDEAPVVEPAPTKRAQGPRASTRNVSKRGASKASAGPQALPGVAEVVPAAATQAPALPSAATLAEEAAILDRAARALDEQRSAVALELVALAASRYGSSQLEQERAAIEIEATWQAGRLGDARARAQRFLHSYPGSLHAPRIRRVLEKASAPSPAAAQDPPDQK